MPRITRTIITEKPREAVFSYLADFSNATEWDPGTEQSEPRHPGGAMPGQVYDLVVTWGSRTLPMVYETTVLEPGERVTFVGDGSTTRAIDTLTWVHSNPVSYSSTKVFNTCTCTCRCM